MLHCLALRGMPLTRTAWSEWLTGLSMQCITTLIALSQWKFKSGLFSMNQTAATQLGMPIIPLLPVWQRVINDRQTGYASMVVDSEWFKHNSGTKSDEKDVRFGAISPAGLTATWGRRRLPANNDESVGLEAGAGCHNRLLPVLAHRQHGWWGSRVQTMSDPSLQTSPKWIDLRGGGPRTTVTSAHKQNNAVIALYLFTMPSRCCGAHSSVMASCSVSQGWLECNKWM